MKGLGLGFKVERPLRVLCAAREQERGAAARAMRDTAELPENMGRAGF